MTSLYLASSSPRRHMLLKQLGLEFTIIAPEVDETLLPNEAPVDYVLRVADSKAQKALQSLSAQQQQTACLLGADTIVTIDGKILGKPNDKAEAIAMLLQLSGKTHQVITAVSLQTLHQQLSLTVYTDVSMRVISETEALAYWQTQEPKGKAGGYAIQGIASIFISQIQGDYYNVVGLPLYGTSQLLKQVGIEILQDT